MGKSRDGFQRIVLFQPRTGWVADLPGSHFLASSIEGDVSTFETGDGREEPVSRAKTWTVRVTDHDDIHQLRLMEKEGCDLQAIGVGWGNHMMWYSNSGFVVRDFGNGPGSFAGVAVTLRSTLFRPAVWRSDNVIAGVPWECEQGVQDATDSNYYFQGYDGYAGPRWNVLGTDANAGTDGALSASASGDPTLDILFPLAGAVIEAGGSWIGSILQLDWSGATLSTLGHNGAAGNTDVIEAGCWKLRFAPTSASTTPKLFINTPGASANRTGGCIDCSNPAATYSGPPSWSS